MTTPRKLLVDPQTPLFYHLGSRCVRRGWLCGYDPVSRKDYTYRKQWILDRLEQLTPAFALEVHAYAIMSNHFHLVVYFDPCANQAWSDAEVVQRWLTAHPPKKPDGTLDEDRRNWLSETLLDQPLRIAQMRQALGSLSYFMQQLKQPIARRANLEEDRSGHFFEQRFYSGALLDEAAVMASLAYVDLNPIRAQIADSIANAHFTSAQARLVTLADADDLAAYLAPVMTGLPATVRLEITVRDYLERLEDLLPGAPAQTRFHRWRDQVAALKRRQRAYGGLSVLKAWIEQRGLQLREIPLPE
jgi:REP element-mobilizing transposase RayT